MKYILFDATRLTTLQTCPQKYEYSHELNLTHIQTPTYFDVGTMIHKTLRTYYGVLKYRDRFIGSYGYDKLTECCIKIAEHIGLRLRIDTDDLIHLTNILKEYFEYYKGDPKMSGDIIGCEQYFSKKCGELFTYQDEEYQVVLEGRIDLIMNNNNKIEIWDHKHESARRTFSMIRNQFLLYPWATNSRDLIINVIGTQKSKKANEKFYRIPYHYDEELINEFESDVIDIGKEYIRYKMNEKFPRHRNSCDTYGLCEFDRVCTVGKDLRGLRIEREYKLRKWSPYEC